MADVKAKSVDLHPDRRLLQVDWDEKTTDCYPFIWLRDCCQCSHCFEKKSQTRAIHFPELDINSKPIKAEVNGPDVCVTWEDGHVSSFSGQWLRERSFDIEARQLRNRLLARKVKTWNALHMQNPPRARFDDILNDDQALYDWMATLEETGLIILTDAPTEEGAVRLIGERVAYLSPTHYGVTSVVRTKANPSNLAFSTKQLTLHTDMEYLQVPPGMQMLHCIAQTRNEGGGNELVDGFHVAEILRRTDPEAFRLLSEIELNFYDIGEEDGREFHMMSKHPTIELGLDKSLKQIHFSTHGRTSGMPIELDQVEPLYRALHKFVRLCYDTENMIVHKMKDGDILCFNNQRILHGRAGFKMQPSGERILEAGYIDWDDLHCKRRVLKDKLGISIQDY